MVVTMSDEFLSEYEACILCPWECGINRLKGEKGKCEAPGYLKINDYMPHFGEESCLVGEGGSGAIFISHCTLRCIFCQTYELSWKGEGSRVDQDRFFKIIMELVKDGCENINFISPTQYVPHIKWVVKEVKSKSIDIPIVYNTSGFEKEEIIHSLNGTVDIYLTDMKYWSQEVSKKLCGVKNYASIAKEAIKAMHRQVGDLVITDSGIAKRGILVRHLVLPGLVEESFKILEWIAAEVSQNTYVNIMGHYRPCHLASSVPGFNRTLRLEEYHLVLNYAKKLGLKRLDKTHYGLYSLIWSK